MERAGRLRGIAIAFALCLISAPVAIIVAIAILPFRSWIESRFEIESIGHSGPAEWCYLVCYFLVLSCTMWIWWVVRRRAEI